MNRIVLYAIIGFMLLVSCTDNTPIVNEKAKNHFMKGNEFYKMEKFKKAIKEYNNALRYDKKYAMVYLKRGDCYRKLRKPQNAIKDYTRVLKLRPSNARAWYHRGTLKIKLGKKQEGCDEVQRARALCYVPAETFYKEKCE
ncbi:MAG: tetratricopeptide repeat protein [Rhodothermaceae bacterium]